MSADPGPVLVTGGAGFVGSNLAERLAATGRRVRVLDALARPGVERNLDWLRSRRGALIEPVIGDVRDPDLVARAAEGVSAVFHFAAQVAVTTSLEAPRLDFETNVLGAVNVLEAVRSRAPRAPVVFASTNKVYGDLADLDLELAAEGWRPRDPSARGGVAETRPLDFHTPYGCSKGAADQYVLDYARSFGLKTCVLRMSCVYGPRQMGTEDQGWVAHFLIRALRAEPITLYGDGFQVRDVLFVDDAVNAYLRAAERMSTVAGRAFNLGGGPANAVSLRRLLAHVEELIGRRVGVRYEGWRAGDQRWFIADARSAAAALGLPQPLPWRAGVERLRRWLEGESGIAGLGREAAA